MSELKVCVVGLGYIGLPTAVVVAKAGHYVSGVDVSEEVVRQVNSGAAHFQEPDLDAELADVVNRKLLVAGTEVPPSDIFMICVPTPVHLSDDGAEADMSYVNAAADRIAPMVKDGDIVILESTSPVGATDELQKRFDSMLPKDVRVTVAYCPERVLPGHIMVEMINNSRVVGCNDTAIRSKIVDFYRSFVEGEVLETPTKTAEMCKLVENSYRDVNIAFANELSILCDEDGIDVWELIRVANRHPRVNILSPGAGVGGHCIAIDPWFIVARSPKEARIIKMARVTNDEKTDWVINRIQNKLDELRGLLGREPKLACLGVAFKPDVDDLRGAPALRVYRHFLDAGIETMAVDPMLDNSPSVVTVPFEEAVPAADVIVSLVAHSAFKSSASLTLLEGRDVFDCCGLLSDEQ